MQSPAEIVICQGHEASGSAVAKSGLEMASLQQRDRSNVITMIYRFHSGLFLYMIRLCYEVVYIIYNTMNIGRNIMYSIVVEYREVCYIEYYIEYCEIIFGI